MMHPRAYNGEAHLDSLGLCVFLAFVKRFNTGVPYLVLDDVVSSIDSQHRSRICDLLFTEFKDYQLFITTHDALWFEELQAYQRARKFDPALFLKIVSWTIDDGARMDKHKPRWDYISDKVKQGDKPGAASATVLLIPSRDFNVSTSAKIPISLGHQEGFAAQERIHHAARFVLQPSSTIIHPLPYGPWWARIMRRQMAYI